MLHEEALWLAQSNENKLGPQGGAATWLGKWTNQIGSTMELSVVGHDVTGIYTSENSQIAGGGSVTGSLKGYVAADVISFTVLWPGGSITAWVGQLVDDADAPRIKTLWQLVTDIPDAQEPKKLWTTTLAGADEFHR
jgi:hypothetical protein